MTYTQWSPGVITVDQLNNTGTLLTRNKHYFHGDAATSFGVGPTDYSGWKEGKEYQTEEYASNGTTILRRSEKTWEQPIASSTWPLTQPETNNAAKANNPQITQAVNTVEPAQANKVSKQTFAYDKYTNQTDVYEYDFGVGAAGSLVRRSQTNYLTSSYDTLNPSSSNPNLSLTSHIRNLPARVSIFDGVGVERARSTTEYDNYVLDGSDCLHSFYCPLQSRANISGFDSLFSTSYTMRGNPTRSTRYLLSNGVVTGSVSAHSHYDVAGNVIRVIDPGSTASNFIITKIEYDDRFGTPDTEARSNSVPGELTGFTSFAFPTKVINALSHTSYAQFNYYLGVPVNGEDANGIVAAGYFNDQLDRATQIRRAMGTGAENQTAFAYDDANRLITTSSDKDAYGDNLLVSKVKYDQLGRTTETRQYEGGANYIVTVTQYDALSRPFKTSNPFRPWKSETAVWSTQAFDALGRMISVTTPDGATVATAYSGDRALVTDQAGKQRISRTNALGQLTDVWEITSPDLATEAVSFPSHPEVTAGYRTTYEYDELDNLKKVTQGSQTRTFDYDSLKRLTSATNPESGTVSYEYDNNSNLRFKTDARGVVTENRYDALNRVTTILYRINGQPDPNTGDIEYLYDNATNGKERLWLTYRWGAKPSHTAVGAYDAMGRVAQLYNLFGDGQGGWSAGYAVNRTYNRTGAVTSQTYPSGHTVTYNYDSAGRLADKDAQNLAFTGNLGDGVQRTYAKGITYASAGQLKQEQFGTTTPVYNKLFYNSRLQLAEILTSTTGGDSSWNRGKILNQYSLQCSGAGCNAVDNNGNLRKQEMFIPANDQVSSYTSWHQQYDYDALNRLQRVHEYTGNPQLDWRQEFLYDRWGNRRIDVANTWGAGINNRSFEKQDTTNRLYAPGDIALADSLRQIRYDAAGNQIKDTYSGYGSAVFDGDNRIVAAQDSNAGWSYYTYNADGQRVRRKIGNQETWQIYGIDGELLAEYAANGAVTSPQKEYGYRIGELLVTAEPGVPSHSNVALASSGATVTSSSTLSPYVPAHVIDGSRRAINSTGWVDNTFNSFPDWIEINFNGSKTISEIDVVTQQDDPGNPVEPTLTQMFSLYGITAFDVQYWNGSAWVTVPGGSVVGNNKVWRQFTFAPITTTKIRVVVNGGADNAYSRVVEVEAWGSQSTTSNIHWLVPDHLGTPRIILDQTGSLANVKRHDYLPFGEELFAGTGGRTAALGYSGGDSVRQQFTSKERDVETGLDYFSARYYSSGSGRFSSPDDFVNDTHPADPQTWNLYTYVRNNPLRFIDPNGQIKKDQNGNVIFEKQSETTMTFTRNVPLRRDDGQVVIDQNGRAMTVTITWKADKGHVFADDGTKIEAFQVTGEMAVTVKDGSGNVNTELSAQLKTSLMDAGSDHTTDCHGTTFAEGQVWINNDQAKKIVRGDGYIPTSAPQPGDVGIYTRNGNLSSTVHSVLVNTVRDGQVVDVTSKGGITRRINVAPGPGANTAWKDSSARLQYFRKRTSGSRQ